MAESDDIKCWWESWKDLIFAAVNTDIPSVCWRRSKMKSWFSTTTIKVIRLKRIVYRKMKRLVSDPLIKKYRLLRNLVCKLTRKDYQACAEELSASLRFGQKQFRIWINKTKHCRHSVPPILYDDVLVVSDIDKAHHFNEYFSSVFTTEDASTLDSLYREMDIYIILPFYWTALSHLLLKF